MRLLFLNRSFWPDVEATGQFLTELCEDLSGLGHEITFVAGPSYHITNRRRFPWRSETYGAVSIVRTWGTRLPKRRLAARLTNLGTYYLLGALAALKSYKPDIVVAATDPPLLGVLGAWLKRLWKCRFVYNVRDLYPDIAYANGGLKNPQLLKLLNVSNAVAYRDADRIILVGHDMAGRVVRKGVPPEKLTVVPDWVDCAQIQPLSGSIFRQRLGQKFVVMYSGNLGLSQRLETVLEAARVLRDDARIVFILVGEGAQKAQLQSRARQMDLPNVLFQPYRPKELLAESLSSADLHLIPLAAGTSGCLVPSKVYGILAAGRPFIAMMDKEAEVAALARDNRVGRVVAPGDSRGLASVVQEAAGRPAELRAMGERARMLALERFDRRVVTRRFAEVLTEVCE